MYGVRLTGGGGMDSDRGEDVAEGDQGLAQRQTEALGRRDQRELWQWDVAQGLQVCYTNPNERKKEKFQR